nr:alcohol dehydrogenase, C-terminal [Tanacetum cinerariifolium]
FEDDHGETKCIDSKVEMENNDEILSLQCCHQATSHCGNTDDPGETKCIDSKVEMENNDEILSKPVKHNGVESSESHLLNILFNILDPIIELFHLGSCCFTLVRGTKQKTRHYRFYRSDVG